MTIVSPTDNASDGIQSKTDQLRDILQIEVQSQVRLWKETLHFRRESIRDRSIGDILGDCPGYGNVLLVNELEFFVLSKIELFRR